MTTNESATNDPVGATESTAETGSTAAATDETASRDGSSIPPERRREDPVLEVRGARVTFGMDRGSARVLDDVSIDVGRNEILGVVGESGSGKSMFASSLLDAVVDPGRLEGSVTYRPADGDPVDVLDLTDEECRRYRWEDVAMVFQGALDAFNPTLSIREHFEETLADHDYDRETGMERARQLLSDLYLDPDRVLGSYPHELSGGMKQRAMIALSLVLDPEVLVMDEPTAALDLLMQRSIVNLVRRIREKYDVTVVFVTHDLPLVANLADRIGVMYAFQFVETGPTEEIVRRPNHPYTRALLRAVPNIDAPLGSMEPVEGQSPDPVNVPAGCAYHRRCPLATDECRERDPPSYGVGPEHGAACHHWEDAPDEIPLEAETGGPEAGGPTAGPGDPPSTTTDPTRTADPIVSLDDVAVRYKESDGLLDGLFGDVDTLAAVDGVSVDVFPTDVVALVGESGCGKTTLGKAMIGLERPTEGSVRYRGQDVWAARDGDGEIPFDQIRRNLQIIHQDPGSSLNPNRTVMATLVSPLKEWRPDLSRDERRGRVLGMLDEVGLTPAEDYAARYPHQLSGGETQRVALVRSMLMNPGLIMADEAVSALDVSLRVEMMDLMLGLQEEFGTSYLFISHNLSNARYLAGKSGGRIGVMYLGELVEVGPAEKVVENPGHPYTRVLKWATPELRPDTDGAEEPPVRELDVPDPVDPPSGCRFHTRCPDAREVCTRENPEDYAVDGENDHRATCFRQCPGHEYWDSPPLDGADGFADADAEGEDGADDAGDSAASR